MESGIEKGAERIPTREEVLEIISHFAENVVLVRELSDEQGTYLLEVKVEGEKSDGVIQYEYMRKGRFINHNEASETAVYVVYYESEMPVGGDKVAVYDSEANEWQKIK